MAYVAKTTRGWGSPGRYIQGPDEIRNLEKYTCIYGKKVLAIIDQFLFNSLSAELNEQYKTSDSTIMTVKFETEITENKIIQTTEAAKDFKPEVVVGIGGGKTIDLAKAVANQFEATMVIVPTAASTDAPTSALSVIYKANGEHSHAIFYNKNPELVLVDSKIIANAPLRFLVSGMGDALSTVFEARANQLSDTANYIWFTSGGFRRCKSALHIAELCYETLLESGFQAKVAVENRIVTQALEDVIEANILMSGLGFENTGCAAAHSIGDGITALPAGSKTFHGEKVAFGTLCQLVAENAPTKLIDEVIKFCISVDLPITLEQLFVEPTRENIELISQVSLKSFWNAEPFNVTEDMISDTIIAADAIGNYYKVNKV